MNSKTLISLSICLALIIGCSKEAPLSQELTQSAQGLTQSQEESALMNAEGATKISGVGFYAETDECDAAGQGATYALKMTGDFVGCMYVFVDDFGCSGNGYYHEEGKEFFIGTYKGKPGTFRTTYKFLSQYEGCNEDGSPKGAEILGFCEHPIVKGSGTDVFEGVTGLYYMIDRVKAGRFPYAGQLKF